MFHMKVQLELRSFTSDPFHKIFFAALWIEADRREQREILACGAYFPLCLSQEKTNRDTFSVLALKCNRKRKRERAKGINFLRVKTPTQGCLSNHYVFFLFIRLKLQGNPRQKGENSLSIERYFCLLFPLFCVCRCSREKNACGLLFEKPHIIIYNIIWSKNFFFLSFSRSIALITF